MITWNDIADGGLDDGLETEFWDSVDICDPQECWEFEGPIAGGGYGYFSFDGDTHRAHRLSYELSIDDPGDFWVLHHCDNPPCVNPNHLYAGTREDNTQDAVERSEWPSYNVGEDSGNSKLTESDVRQIRKKYENGEATQVELADEYGVSQMNISRIVRGERWTHV